MPPLRPPNTRLHELIDASVPPPALVLFCPAPPHPACLALLDALRRPTRPPAPPRPRRGHQVEPAAAPRSARGPAASQLCAQHPAGAGVVLPVPCQDPIMLRHWPAPGLAALRDCLCVAGFTCGAPGAGMPPRYMGHPRHTWHGCDALGWAAHHDCCTFPCPGRGGALPPGPAGGPQEPHAGRHWPRSQVAMRAPL